MSYPLNDESTNLAPLQELHLPHRVRIPTLGAGYPCLTQAGSAPSYDSGHLLVDREGLEPSAFRVQTGCSTR